MAQQQFYEALKKHNFTQGLAQKHLAEISVLAEEVEFEEDQIIFRVGEQSPYLYLLLSGSVCLEIRTPVYSVCVQALGADEAFGWSSLLDHAHTLFQVRAREPSVALRLDAERLTAACEQNTELGFEVFRRLAEVMAKRLRATEARLGEFCGITDPVKAPRLVESLVSSPCDRGHRLRTGGQLS